MSKGKGGKTRSMIPNQKKPKPGQIKKAQKQAAIGSNFSFALRVESPVSDPRIEDATRKFDKTVEELREQPACLELPEELRDEYVQVMTDRSQVSLALTIAAQTGTFGGIGSRYVTDNGPYTVVGTTHKTLQGGHRVEWVVNIYSSKVLPEPLQE